MWLCLRRTDANKRPSPSALLIALVCHSLLPLKLRAFLMFCMADSVSRVQRALSRFPRRNRSSLKCCCTREARWDLRILFCLTLFKLYTRKNKVTSARVRDPVKSIMVIYMWYVLTEKPVGNPEAIGFSICSICSKITSQI